MLKAIFFDMDETLCGTSQADKIAGQEFADWIAQTYPQITDSTAFVQRYLQGVYKRQLKMTVESAKSMLPHRFQCLKEGEQPCIFSPARSDLITKSHN